MEHVRTAQTYHSQYERYNSGFGRALELRNISPGELSKLAGLSSSQVRVWIDRRSERVAADVLRRVAGAAHVSARWLITGNGTPDDDDETSWSDGEATSSPPSSASDEAHERTEPLPPGRMPTAAALVQLVPYRVAAWAADTHARASSSERGALSRSENRHGQTVTFTCSWYIRTRKTLRTC